MKIANKVIIILLITTFSCQKDMIDPRIDKIVGTYTGEYKCDGQTNVSRPNQVMIITNSTSNLANVVDLTFNENIKTSWSLFLIGDTEIDIGEQYLKRNDVLAKFEVVKGNGFLKKDSLFLKYQISTALRTSPHSFCTFKGKKN